MVGRGKFCDNDVKEIASIWNKMEQPTCSKVADIYGKATETTVGKIRKNNPNLFKSKNCNNYKMTPSKLQKLTSALSSNPAASSRQLQEIVGDVSQSTILRAVKQIKKNQKTLSSSPELTFKELSDVPETGNVQMEAESNYSSYEENDEDEDDFKDETSSLSFASIIPNVTKNDNRKEENHPEQSDAKKIVCNCVLPDLVDKEEFVGFTQFIVETSKKGPPTSLNDPQPWNILLRILNTQGAILQYITSTNRMLHELKQDKNAQ